MSVEPVANRLLTESSPYLLQHAQNPVDWYPWGSEALERARREDRPILLSIGYSACHWCHVMAHECFEDPDIAAVMNARFINIKVDREERPDLDKIYQSAHQLLTGRGGGWPLTLVLTPQQEPFFAGTYFPPSPRHGLPAFADLLQRIDAVYREHRDQIDQQNASLLQALHRMDRSGDIQPAVMDTTPVARAMAQLTENFDAVHGGFGQAPKFPHPSNLELLLQRPAPEHRHMALHTLRNMADGGMYDQLGGGFFRYSVDGQWQIPHFEKMLYDNGPLLLLYSEAWRMSGEPRFAEVTRETGEWVMREMQGPDGGYYATLDADSEGAEGGFYIWDAAQVEQHLEHDEYQVLSLRYGLDQHPNFEERWHLSISTPIDGIAATLGLPRSQVHDTLNRARGKLFMARNARPAPGRDEKVLAGWNGLMIKGMARAGRLLNRTDFVDSSVRALDFVQRHQFRDGRLLAVCNGTRARLSAYLDDYAFLLDATLEVLQTRWSGAHLKLAMALADTLLEHFEDEAHGGFYFTADDHESLIQRPKPLMDEATPSGNGVAAKALLRLGHLLGDLNYLDAAQWTLEACWSAVNDAPYAHAALLMALTEWQEPTETIVVRADEHQAVAWRRALERVFVPQRQSFVIPIPEQDLPGALAGRIPAVHPIAYRCQGHHCTAPITDPSAL